MRPRVLRQLLIFLAVTSLACGPSAGRPEDVRRAILDSGVIGQTPSYVEKRLAELRLPHGNRLEVGSFDEKRLIIEASVRDAKGRPDKNWILNVSILFDSLHKARDVDAHYSAVSPL